MRAHLKRVDSEFARGWDLVKDREGGTADARPGRKPSRRSAAKAAR
jgi:hypothetical protein